MNDKDVRKLMDTSIERQIKVELDKVFESKRKRIFSKITAAALGSIPWVGGLLSAAAGFRSEEGQVGTNTLIQEWLEEHKAKMQRLAETLVATMKRLDEFPEDINNRLESEEYLQVVRRSFKSWDNADTQEKRELVRKLLTNAGTTSIDSDDLIRLFLDWIDLYHDIHFAVIKTVYQNPEATRLEIWRELRGKEVREDSMEADLFRLLIRDLSTGGVLRQHRATDYQGNFIKKTPKKTISRTTTMKSAFDDSETYELTELGQKFVHYTMDEVVPRIS